MHAFSLFMAFLVLLSCAFGVEAFAYNYNYLDDLSWVDDESAVTKYLKYDKDENETMDCAVTYLVDEINSAVYFQILTSNFNSRNNSDIRVIFDIESDNKHYSFYVDDNGIQGSDEVCKMFSAGSKFRTSKTISSGTYLVAVDVKTKANTNRIHAYFSVDGNKYDLIEGIVINKPIATKEHTTKLRFEAHNSNNTDKITNKNTSDVTVALEFSDNKSNKKLNNKIKNKTEKITKFKGGNKYHTTAQAKHKSVATTALKHSSDKSNAVAVTPEWNKYNKASGFELTKNKSVLVIGVIVGTVGLLLIAFAFGKLSNKSEVKTESTVDNLKCDNNALKEDDFDF